MRSMGSMSFCVVLRMPGGYREGACVRIFWRIGAGCDIVCGYAHCGSECIFFVSR